MTMIMIITMIMTMIMTISDTLAQSLEPVVTTVQGAYHPYSWDQRRQKGTYEKLIFYANENGIHTAKIPHETDRTA